jgi:uncharacterized protein (TIGR02453 family)
MKNILKYLNDLEANNDREWFRAHKNEYVKSSAIFERTIEAFIEELSRFEATPILCKPKDLIFRLARDMRFSRDRTPYNPSFRACISPFGRAIIPVAYYVSIAPKGRSFLSCGLYAATIKEATEAIRDYIDENSEAFGKIIEDKNFAKRFIVQGEKLKNVPAQFDKNSPYAEYLKNKSWYLQYGVSDDLLCAENFIDQSAKIFRAMKPFNDFLNAALQDCVHIKCGDKSKKIANRKNEL